MMLIKQLKIQRKQFSATITFQIKTKIKSFSPIHILPSTNVAMSTISSAEN